MAEKVAQRSALDAAANGTRVLSSEELEQLVDLDQPAFEQALAERGIVGDVAIATVERWADLRRERGRRPTRETAPASSGSLRFLWGPQFIDQPREQRLALLGGEDDMLIPAAGLVIVGGPGGSGKSTLTLHAIAHLASGLDWLEIPVGKPLRVGAIENEGPKDPYITKLERFAERWSGPDFLSNVAFLDSPWGRFSFADPGLRGELRAFVVEAEIELLVAGPLGRLGVEGAGSPEETRAFLALLAEVGCQRDVAVWLLHHVNKGRHPSIVQALSGDWGGHPDLILGVEHEEGQRRTKLTFGKVRWGNAGRRPLLLEWLPDGEGVGYVPVDIEAPAETAATNRRRVLEAVGRGLGTAKAIADDLGLAKNTVSGHMKTLERSGEIELTSGANRTVTASVRMAPDAADPAEEACAPEELAWR